MKQELLNELFRIKTLTQASPRDTQTMFNLYRQLINKDANLCASCPSSVRKVHQGLVHYYNLNKAKLEKEIKEENKPKVKRRKRKPKTTKK